MIALKESWHGETGTAPAGALNAREALKLKESNWYVSIDFVPLTEPFSRLGVQAFVTTADKAVAMSEAAGSPSRRGWMQVGVGRAAGTLLVWAREGRENKVRHRNSARSSNNDIFKREARACTG